MILIGGRGMNDDHMVYEHEGIRVSWVDLGEGWGGEYNEDDPNDQPLLRFDVELHRAWFPVEAWGGRCVHGDWFMPQDASYCTRMPADSPPEVLRAGLEYLWTAVNNRSPRKRVLEHLSWIEPAWLAEDGD